MPQKPVANHPLWPWASSSLHASVSSERGVGGSGKDTSSPGSGLLSVRFRVKGPGQGWGDLTGTERGWESQTEQSGFSRHRARLGRGQGRSLHPHPRGPWHVLVPYGSSVSPSVNGANIPAHSSTACRPRHNTLLGSGWLQGGRGLCKLEVPGQEGDRIEEGTRPSWNPTRVTFFFA